MDASSSAGVSKGEVRLRKFAPDAGLAADSKFLLHWFGLSAKKNGCVDEELPRLSPWTHCAKDTALADADTQYVPQSESELRKFADMHTAVHVLPCDSLHDGKSMEDKLPRPSPRNHFARNVSKPGGGQGGTHGCH